MVTSAGMFISSTALLPSTTSMYFTLLSMGAWFQHHYKLAIFFTACSTFLSMYTFVISRLPKTNWINLFRLAFCCTYWGAHSCRHSDIQEAVADVHKLVCNLRSRHPDAPDPGGQLLLREACPGQPQHRDVQRVHFPRPGSVRHGVRHILSDQRNSQLQHCLPPRSPCDARSFVHQVYPEE